MDQDVELEVRACNECQKKPPTVPLHPWEWTKAPWSQIPIYYSSPFLDEVFFSNNGWTFKMIWHLPDDNIDITSKNKWN